MTIWLNAHLSPAIAVWITTTFSITVLAVLCLGLKEFRISKYFRDSRSRGWGNSDDLESKNTEEENEKEVYKTVDMESKNTEEENQKEAYKTVLIVEDDLVNARVYSKILRKRGKYEIKHTENTYEVLFLAESGTIDIILMDVSLSRSTYHQGRATNGIQITQLLKSNSKTWLIPVILVTAHAMPGDRETFLDESGADYYISKPVVNHQDFVDKITHCVYSSRVDRLINVSKFLAREAYVRGLTNELQLNLRDRVNQMIIEERQQECEKLPERQIVSLSTNNRMFEENDLQQKNQPFSDNALVQELEAQTSTHTSQASSNSTSQMSSEIYQLICADVAHSLRGEFLNIGYSNQEICNLSNNSPEILEECELIQRSLEYSQARLQKLIDYVNLSQPPIEIIKIDKLIVEVELLYRPRLPSNITMEVQIQADLKGRMILGNLDQMKSILIELIRNSIKALQKPQGIIQILVTCKNKLVNISVKDNGSGIPEEVKKKLFEKAIKSDRGSGMGLYLSNKIMRQMGGDFKLQSSEQGTIVTLTSGLIE